MGYAVLRRSVKVCILALISTFFVIAPQSAQAAYETIALEAPGTSKVLLGDLATRSGSTKANQLVLTKSGTAGAYTYAGSDSQTANAFTFNSLKNYASVSNLKQSIDVTAGSNISTTSNTSVTYSGRSSVGLFSSGTVTPIQNGTPYTQAANDPFMSYFGPEIYSVPFSASVGQSLAYSWAALGTGDDYEIYVFLVKVSDNTGSTCTSSSGAGSYGLSSPLSTHTLLTYSRGKDQPWTDESGAIPSNGCYRFRFVAGTYDATGGFVVGGNLYVSASTILLGLTQTITFPQPADIDASASRVFSAGATSNAAGATLTYLSNSLSVCTVDAAGMITVLTTGACSITASSGAFGDYTAATSVTRGFTISAVPAVATASGPLAYRIDFNPGTGAGYMNPQYAYPLSPFNLYPNLYKKDGFSFTGWNTKADGTGTSYAEGSSLTISTADINLYAQWKLIQIKPTIAWPTPIAIEEGTALSPTQLNALASVPGTYTYAPAAAALLPVGKHTLKVTFVPTDPKFETIESTVEIEVLAKAKVTWTNPASIVEGTPLSPTQLNATASVPGTFTYSPGNPTVLPVGTQTLAVTFKPTDARLSSVTTQVTIVVTAKPIVIPGAPVSPTYSVTGGSKTTVVWGAGANAATYNVKADGKIICQVAVLTCDAANLLGPKNKVTVTSVAANARTSADTPAVYVGPAAPISLASINFDSARSVVKASEARKLRTFATAVRASGLITLTVYGHTDSVGGVDNQKLSQARATSTITFLKKLLPGVSFKVSGFAASDPVADNTSAEGKAANRRAEIFIP